VSSLEPAPVPSYAITVNARSRCPMLDSFNLSMVHRDAITTNLEAKDGGYGNVKFTFLWFNEEANFLEVL
jgi:hypothetical protein